VGYPHLLAEQFTNGIALAHHNLRYTLMAHWTVTMPGAHAC
jgi:hypothetical protein